MIGGGLCKLRIGYAVAIAMRPAAIAALLAEIVNCFWRHIVAEHVAAVYGDPHGIGLRIHGDPHGIAQSFGEDLLAAAVRIEFHYRRAPLIFFDADVAARSGRDVHLAV